MKYLKLFAILLVAGTVQTQAQWSGSLSLGSGYDDNAFSNATALASSFGFASVELGYYPKEENLALSYDGMLATYGDYPERRYSTHQIVGSYIFTYSEKSMLYTNGGFGVRIDAPDYEYYDYHQAYITLGSRHYIGEIMNLRTGYRFRYRQYTNFNDMSYGEHIGWLGVNTSFATRTSVTLRAELGAKQYSPIENDYSAPPTLPQLALNGGGGNGGNGGGGNGGGGEGGSGNGGEGGSGNGEGGGGNGMGSGNGMHIGETAVGSGGLHSRQFITYDNTTTSQLRLAATVGQSITETTGLSLNYVKRVNLDDRSRAVVGGTVDFIGEEELFDDPYSYESDEATLKITQVINERMMLKVAGFGMIKAYSYPSDLSLLDLSGVPMREDRRFGGWAMLTYRVPGSWLLFSGLDVGLSYVYTRNESNTSWYDYSANDISIQVGTDF